MDYRKFSKKQLADILDIIHASVTCKDDDDLSRLLFRIKELVCADHGVCGLGDVDSGRLTGVVKIVNLDYPAEWLNMYAVKELYKQDPIIRFNYEFFKTHLWKDALDIYREAPYREFMGMASEFGLRHGVASGINEQRIMKGSIFSFSASRDRFTGYHTDILDILTPHVHQTLSRLSSVKRNVKELSAREKEVLKWMKEGKTNWEISVILNISERTVKFHVQNIERKLDAVNKTHAIALAMDNGLVA